MRWLLHRPRPRSQSLRVKPEHSWSPIHQARAPFIRRNTCSQASTTQNQKCDEFFDRLAQFQQDTSLVDKVLASSITAATPLMAVYGVGAAPIAVTAATIAYAQNINKYTAEIYAFAPYATQLKRHVKDQLDAYLKGITSDWKQGRLQSSACTSTGGCYNELERLVVVRGRAQQYANICSIANLRAIVDSSLANTTSVCKDAGATPSATGTAVTNCKSKGI